MSNTDGFGQAQPYDAYSPFNTIAFMIRQMMADMSTLTPVQVVKCTNDGGLSTVGTVDVQPLVTFLDGNGNATTHGQLYSLPYFRLQGGTNAVICDPVAGDIGFAIFADQDISAFKANKGPANPGSGRKFDMSDGLFCGGILNGTPTQYVQFTSFGIVIADKNGNKIEMKSGSIAMTTTSLTVTGSIIAGFGGGDQVNVQTHKHPTAATGAPSPPTPGT